MGLLSRIFNRKRLRIRIILNGFCAIALVFLLYNRQDSSTMKYPLSRRSSFLASSSHWSSTSGSTYRRRMVESGIQTASNASVSDFTELAAEHPEFCWGLLEHMGYDNSCEFLKAHSECSSGGFFDYLQFYYCTCKRSSWAFLVLAIWLFTLFYLLGNTAADYFCPSLEKLSSLLKLSPSVAGVSLLPLGNGAPDVFASIAAFTGTGTGGVGLNSVLGGAVFVTCVVVGVVSLCVADQTVQIDRKCFIRDIIFIIVTLTSLLVILVVGRVSVVGAIFFILIYVAYGFVVAANEILRKQVQRLNLDVVTPLLPVRGSIFSQGAQLDDSVYNPLLDIESENDGLPSHCSLPQWMWASNVAIYSNQAIKVQESDQLFRIWNDEGTETGQSSVTCSKLCLLIEWPLTVPRRLTIPLVDEESWSKFYAVTSASLAPVLLSFMWSTQEHLSDRSRNLGWFLGVSVGFVLGVLAYQYTRSDRPPRRFLFPWVLGGFLMCIVWFYLIANELVALLVSLGVVMGVSPSILALTVLAWGNSIGDLVSNTALAMNGGDGVQIAMSGCYAGPLFNALIGLGVSMLLGALSTKPGSFLIPLDNSLYYTMGFLVAGLVWALFILPKNDMRPNRVLGVGLISIYFLFLCVRISSDMGFFSLAGLR